LPRAPPDVNDANDLGAVVNRKEHAIDVRAPTVVEHANRMIRIETLGCYRAPFWVPIEREDRQFETVEPDRTLLRSPLDDPQVQFFEFGFRAPRDVNAICHACGATG